MVLYALEEVMCMSFWFYLISENHSPFFHISQRRNIVPRATITLIRL